MEFNALKDGNGSKRIDTVDMSVIATLDAVFFHEVDQRAADIVFKFGWKVGEHDFFKAIVFDGIKRKLESGGFSCHDFLIVAFVGCIGGVAVPPA